MAEAADTGSVELLAWLTLLLPLAGALLNGLLFRVTGRSKLAGLIGTAALAGSFVCAILMALALQGLGEEERQVRAIAWDYARTVGIDAQLGLLVDPLSVFMTVVITGVSTLIHLYSVSYLSGDRGYARYFAYLNFFVFSMLLLILAGNFLLLIVGWAFVGMASYLLISYWFRRDTATRAGIKAFVINVLGDVGLVLGTFFIFRGTGTLDFLTTFERVNEAFAVNEANLVAGCVLLLVGAFAKSAQIPFHTWLADAMEGPTPVSALIHAATMVTAGVYLIARMFPLFERAPNAAAVGAIVGTITMLVAATIALVVTDLKRIIAYSTMSQIGYMVMAVSSGAYVAGIFHFATHAFFKALLFMAAGSVIGAMAGLQDIGRMGGFRKAMPFTFATFVIGGLALAGLPPFSGFFSKDEILAYVADRGDWHVILVVVGYVTALLTAAYTARMVIRVFLGSEAPEARELRETGHLAHHDVPTNPVTGEEEDTDVGFPGPEHHIAEHAFPMKLAMGLLALFAIIAGFTQIPEVTHLVDDFLEPTFAESRFVEGPEKLDPSVGAELAGLAIGAALAVAGLLIGFAVWARRPGTSARYQQRFAALHRLFVNKWYFDELIDRGVVRPAQALGRFSQTVVERVFVNGIVDATTGLVRGTGAGARAAQTGFLRSYTALIVIGMAGVALYFLIAAS
jgi:NADH-quinone oxidoreductase subunit L